MALKQRRSRTWLSRLHFLVRLLGLTGLLAACAGLAMAHTLDLLTSLEGAWETAREAALGQAQGPLLNVVTVYLILGGAAATVLALLIEVVIVLWMTAGRRSASGLNAVIQVGVAAALLVGINVYSFLHHHRADLTRDHRFTLSKKLRDQLRQLRDDTNVYVLQQRRRADLAPGDEDYEAEAEKVVVDKVRDLVDELRELGPRFRVVVLDASKKAYRSRLREETIVQRGKVRDLVKQRDEMGPGFDVFVLDTRKKDYRPLRDEERGTRGDEEGAIMDLELRKAIREAPESCIVFHTRTAHGTRLQRLNFSDFSRLDQSLSDQENNLVLLSKGVEPFVRRVLNLEEKRPRVGILTVHPALTTQGSIDLFTLAGLRKALEANRFEVRDVVLKTRTGAPAADTIEENKTRRLQAVETEIARLEKAIDYYKKGESDWNDKKQKLADLLKKYDLDGKPTAADRPRVAEAFGVQREIRERLAEDRKQERDRLKKDTASVDADAVAELKRLNDVRAKLERTLADCDLLIVPRYTRLPFGPLITPDAEEFFRLDEDQLGVLKNYLKEGKPMLACLGPTNRPPGQPPAPGEQQDGLEKLLAELGVRCDNETVLFDAEESGEEPEEQGLQNLGVARIPPLDFSTSPEEVQLGGKKGLRPNPLRESFRLASRALGKDLPVKLRFLRPISYEPAKGSRPPFAPEFLLTSPDSRRTDRPFEERPMTSSVPDKKKRGPITVGVAVEAPLPASWKPTAPTVRLAVIGHGGAFVDPTLPPAREKLLLDTCNWLLGRDDLLTASPRDVEAEEGDRPYPRVERTERETKLWLWGTRLGLPVLFAYLGLVVLMRRRLR